MVFLETFATGVFLEFLKRLIRQNNRKIFLIVDGHPVHRSKKVKEWLAKHTDRIRLYFLPGYSPELNPAEYLNQDVKSNAAGKRRPHNLTELLVNVRNYLHSRQRKPEVVANYFVEKRISYAAV